MVLRRTCLPYLSLIRFVTPAFDINLVSDDMIDDSEDLLQLQAAT